MPTYKDSLQWLFAQTRAGAERNPERMRKLISVLGLRQPPRSVHVVGTNGKGSVSQLITAGLDAAGLKVGHFTSPHVEDFRERIVIAKEEISEQEVVDFVEKVRRLSTPFAFFELSFALALLAFENRGVDIAVVEAGVGAAKDATRALENVQLSVLTNVSLDHQGTLGNSLEAIAEDKAEVMRPDTAFVTAEQNETVLKIFQTHARALNAPFYSLATAPELFKGVNESHSTDTQNKRLASAALRLLSVEEVHISQGLKSAPSLPARQEIFLLGNKTVILDGGHNPAAVTALIEKVGKADILIFGTLAKREGKGLFNLLEPHFSQVIVTSVEGARPEWLESSRFIPIALEAVDIALESLTPNGTLLIAGSFYLAGQVRPHLRDLAQMTA